MRPPAAAIWAPPAAPGTPAAGPASSDRLKAGTGLQTGRAGCARARGRLGPARAWASLQIQVQLVTWPGSASNGHGPDRDHPASGAR
jgi:hypothetical protein